MKRAKHSLSNYRLASMNQGEIYPIGLQEVLPGDSFRQRTSALIRVSPLVAPVMHPVRVSIHHWFVPNRILWNSWEDFITGKNTALVVPTLSIAAANTAAIRFANSLGIGIDAPPAPVLVNSLPFRAYNLIYNEFYRDQDLTTAVPTRTGDSGDVVADYLIRMASWEKDYFTTARPYPQQGNNTEVVQLNLTGTVPVSGLGSRTQTFSSTPVTAFESNLASRSYSFSKNIDQTNTNDQVYMEGTAATGYPKVNVNLANIQGGSVTMDINAWRTSMAMQRIREHRNKYGSRYRDMLAFLGVRSSDARLQRPEYLGGGKQVISFSEVLSTAETTEAVVGDMAGHGIAAMRHRPYKRFFEEHGYVLSFMIVRPQTVYQQSVPRTFLRRDYEHFWQKELEMMGEQAITNAEIYGDSATPSSIFGYQGRFDEYRHAESSVSGEFRSILDYWHMARIFGSQPVLNASFVEANPTDRIYASAVNDELYVMASHQISARRLVSKRARA